ncbi:transporter substrate-binding domain-containing protein [Thalassotalea sp. LPB0316]|uniref:substrate-binding periplasmic protein n=1 Tax=Thalassotalea sp. LPB0316 TaxID=2769490 RepID=UPI001868885B|nr:ABC transporter substrate-binding protein [Thalassotalea sp. LPB0316]QOL25626.1 transporter substrate-binding domain-containing protein [Thalassotalea sp. LPB0316]
MLLKVGFVVVALLLAGAETIAQDELTIFTEAFPPYSFQQGDEVVGLNIDIIKMACKNANINCTFQLYPWQRSYNYALKHNNSGVVSTSRTPDREQQFNWVGPLVDMPTCFYKVAIRDDIVVNHRDDLLNYTIGLARNDVYEQILKSWGFKHGKNYISFNEKYAYMQAFKAGKLDLFLASANTINKHLSLLNLSFNDVIPIFLLNDDNLGGNYLALNKSVPPQLTLKLQAEVENITRSTTLDKLKNQYIPEISHDYSPTSKVVQACL